MGFFSGTESSVEVVDPLAQQKTQAANWLLELMTGGTPNIPLQGIAGMTDTELMGQDILKGFAGGGQPEGYTLGMDYLKDYAAEPTDITKLPEYEAILSRVGKEGDERVNQTLRRIQRGGMSHSTPQGKAVGREVGHTLDTMTAQLAPFAEAERMRRFQIPGMFGQFGEMEQGNIMKILASIAGYGGLPREIEQQEANALFQQLMEKIMFPYMQAGLAGGITGTNIQQAIKAGGPSELQKISGVGKDIMSILSLGMTPTSAPSSGVNEYSDFANSWMQSGL